MAIDSVTVGANTREVIVIGDPTTAAAELSVGQYHTADGQTLSASIYDLLTGAVPLLINTGGTFDRQHSAPGTTGIPAVSTESTKATYAGAVLGFTPAATPTDIFQVVGSATKIVRVLRVSVSGIATAAATIDLQLIKRTAANTGGTTASVTINQYDSNDSAATALVNKYTANAGALGAGTTLRAQALNLGAAGAAGTIVWDFSTRNGKGLVLRGIAQSLGMNWNAAAVPAGTVIDIDVEFTEES